MVNLSIVVPFHNEGQNVFHTLDSIINNTKHDYEVVVVNDGSYDTDYLKMEKYPNFVRYFKTDRSGSPAARNFGAKKSRGENIIFLDAHMMLEDGWDTAIASTLDSFEDSIVSCGIHNAYSRDMVGYGFTFSGADLGIQWLPKIRNDEYEIPMAGGACMAMKKNTFLELGGFDGGLRPWGREDAEMCLRAWLFGYRVVINPAVSVGHIFRKSFPYQIENYQINKNVLRLAYSHLSATRLAKVIDFLKQCPDFEKTRNLGIKEGIHKRRSDMFKRRKHDDDFFFKKFKITI